MRSSDGMKRSSTWHEPFHLCIIRTRYQSHKLRHTKKSDLTHKHLPVPMKPGWTECIFSHHPSRRKNNKIRQRSAVPPALHSQDGENRGVRVVKRHGVDGIEERKVVFVRSKVSMPSHHVKGAMSLCCEEKMGLVLVEDLIRCIVNILVCCLWI